MRGFNDEIIKEIIEYCGGDSTMYEKWLNKPTNLKELLNYDKGITIDLYDLSLADPSKHSKKFLFDQRGYATSLESFIEYMVEYLISSENSSEEELWDSEKSEYIYDNLEMAINNEYPKMLEYFIKNTVTAIKFDW